jgi:hypothetical protein
MQPFVIVNDIWLHVIAQGWIENDKIFNNENDN